MRRRTRRRRAIAAVMALALVVAACGGEAETAEVASLEDGAPPEEALAAGDDALSASDTTAAPGGGDAEQDPEEAMLAFAACMREHGVDLPDPEIDADGNLRLARPGDLAAGDDFDRDAARAAREACDDQLSGVTFGFRQRDRTEIEDALVAYAACMRANGFDLPDPDLSSFAPGSGRAGPGQGGGPFGGLDRSDPAFQAADEVCRAELGGIGPSGGFGRRGAEDDQ